MQRRSVGNYCSRASGCCRRLLAKLHMIYVLHVEGLLLASA